ncbi:metal-sensing transcriptional repressor, partial [Litorivivens sp.]|uniref:metal-sensing transcriptional repressor n=1 Tax=Litorivivens sp. TaxID=2020868 RepID=UPI003566D4D5
MTDWFEKKQEMQNRLKRAEGQLRGVQRLIEEEEECEKVVQQLAAVRKALDKVFYKAVTCALERELDGQLVDISRIEKYTQLLAKYA